MGMTAGEVCDSSCISVKALQAFYEKEMTECKEQDILLSLHLKATMMKVSDPIIFGHAVKVFFKDLFAKHGAVFTELGVNVNNGFGDLVGKLGGLPEEKRKEIEADIDACYATRPKLAMVNSNRGITNLHVPSDVIIDASMPSMIRGMDGLGGGMWCPDSKPGARDSHLQDTKALIPDRCYAPVFKEPVEYCKKHGAFDPATMGSVPNVGLMALKAEEYGSHPTTFEAPSKGKMKVVNETGDVVLLEHDVNTGDIWRSCQTKDIAIKDWVKLAVTRASAKMLSIVPLLQGGGMYETGAGGSAPKHVEQFKKKSKKIEAL